MALSPKAEFIQAFFDNLGLKLERIQDLYDKSYKEEAFILCVVYIDWLASGYYGGEPGHNRQSFCKALKELSANPVLGMLHSQELAEQTKENCPSATTLIESLVNKRPHELLAETEVSNEIRGSSLRDSEKGDLIANLWRASIANILYERIRNRAIHGQGILPVTFDETINESHQGLRIDFHVLRDALRNIVVQVKAISVEKGEWFGNPKFMNPRKQKR